MSEQSHETAIFGNEDGTMRATCSCGWEQSCPSMSGAVGACRAHLPAFQKSWDSPIQPSDIDGLR